jgi:hypothetical protein
MPLFSVCLYSSRRDRSPIPMFAVVGIRECMIYHLFHKLLKPVDVVFAVKSFVKICHI